MADNVSSSRRVSTILLWLKIAPIIVIGVQFLILIILLTFFPLLIHTTSEGTMYLPVEARIIHPLFLLSIFIFFIGIPALGVICIVFTSMSYLFIVLLQRRVHSSFYVRQVQRKTRLGKIIFLLITGWIFVLANVIACAIVSDITQYIALNITDSNTFLSCDACFKFNWDNNLKTAMYTQYFLIFMLVVFLVMRMTDKSDTAKRINKVALALFTLSFPTLTFWPVSTFGGSLKIFPLIVPVVISNQPIFIALSAYMAYRIWLWFVKAI